MTSVTAVIVAYGAEPWLEMSVESVLASTGVRADVVVVDNGCTDGTVDRLEGRTGVTVIRPDVNLGFAGGCNEGAAAASGEVIALMNPDTISHPDALAALAKAALREEVGLATASLRLADSQDLLNSAGNPVHFLGMSWAGELGKPAVDHDTEREVASASGAAMAVRSEVWKSLGGFDDLYFAYVEDVELSVRARQRGLRVVYVPRAVVTHRYEFSRNPKKLYLIERNRTICLLTLYSTHTLVLILPAWILFEIAALVLAAAQGWLREKLDAWRWIWRNRHRLRSLRRQRQAERTVPDRVALMYHTGKFDPGQLRVPLLLEPIDWLIALYWAVIRRLL